MEQVARRTFLEAVAERGEGLGNLLRDLRIDAPLFTDLVEVVSSLREPVNFRRASFSQAADFGSATFRGKAIFDAVTFEADVRFGRTAFLGDASFVGTRFQGDAEFGASAADLARPSSGWDLISGAQFVGDVTFAAAEFHGDALFEGVSVGGGMSFQRADFHAECRLVVEDYWHLVADASGSGDERARQIEAIRAHEAARKIDLRDVRFRDGAVVDLPAAEVDATDLEIGDATRLEVRGPLVLDSISLPHPLLVLGNSNFTGRPAEIVSLRGSTLQAPVIIGNNVGLRHCRFERTLGLEQVQLPANDLALSRPWNRWVLADEVIWRSLNRQRRPMNERLSIATSRTWRKLADDMGPQLHGPADALAIAGLYRQLRRGIEDARNAPGAADFYYGEMEMRRAGTNSRAERTTLWLYWLISGYGLRAWRSLTFLTAVIVATAFAFSHGPAGLHEACPPGDDCRDLGSFPAALVFVTRWSVSLPTPDIHGVSTGGEALLVTARVMTPVLVALTILALRSRVHR